MRIQRLLTTAATVLVLGVSACENETLLPRPNAPVDPMFARYVAIGNSITAGIQSGGLNDSTQAAAYPVLLARAMGSVFFVPYMNRPGCPGPLLNVFTQQRVGGGGASSCFLRAQETAGIDICTDGDAHYDEEIAGMSWQSYAPAHMSGFDKAPQPTIYDVGAVAYPRGHILHDFLEARVLPRIVGPVGRGDLQYTAMWKVAQRMTRRPVKFGTILPELLAASVADAYYKDPVERTMALSEALNAELNDLGPDERHRHEAEHRVDLPRVAEDVDRPGREQHHPGETEQEKQPAGHEVQPARAVQQHEAHVAPGVSEAVEL